MQHIVYSQLSQRIYRRVLSIDPSIALVVVMVIFWFLVLCIFTSCSGRPATIDHGAPAETLCVGRDSLGNLTCDRTYTQFRDGSICYSNIDGVTVCHFVSVGTTVQTPPPLDK